MYEPVEGRLPTYASRDFDQTEIGAPVIEHTLRPGDLLYMPRGFVHQGVVPPSSSAKPNAPSSSSSTSSSSSSGTDMAAAPHSLHLTLSAGCVGTVVVPHLLPQAPSRVYDAIARLTCTQTAIFHFVLLRIATRTDTATVGLFTCRNFSKRPWRLQHQKMKLCDVQCPATCANTWVRERWFATPYCLLTGMITTTTTDVLPAGIVNVPQEAEEHGSEDGDDDDDKPSDANRLVCTRHVMFAFVLPHRCAMLHTLRVSTPCTCDCAGCSWAPSIFSTAGSPNARGGDG